MQSQNLAITTERVRPRPRLIVLFTDVDPSRSSAPLRDLVGALSDGEDAVWFESEFTDDIARCAEDVRVIVGNSSFLARRAAAQPHGARASMATMSGSRQSEVRTAPRGGMAPGALRRVLDSIEARLAESIDLSGLARLARLSECHFSRAFKQSVGMPPHRYVMSRRVSVASAMLRQTDRPLTEIALDVGFSDHSHFTRMFARLTGQTPSAFRRRHR